MVGLPGQGFVVIEVKGGTVGHTDEGWIQYTPEGPKPIDPAGQADRAKRLLDSYARQRTGRTARSGSSTWWRSLTQDFGRRAARAGPRRGGSSSPRATSTTPRGGSWDALDKRITDKPRPSAAWVDELADLLGGRPDPARALLGVAHGARGARATC